ncbi:MAG: hypothetical protein ACOX3E_07310 [Desulfomonilia bacterium]|jgi:hypothetical protein
MFSQLLTMGKMQSRYLQYVLQKPGGRVWGQGGAAEILGMKRTSSTSE